MELHGGTVQVRSEGLGRGSEFIVVLPVSSEAAVPEASPALPTPAPRTCRTLIIEDNVDANEALNLCLTFLGHTAASAFDGLSGLAMTKQGDYELIICDIGLPGMDGYEVLRQIRQLSLVPRPYCIAMTGYDQSTYRAHALEAGFDHYLVKPVAMDALQDVISKAFAQQR